jgi:antitoxin component of RelBE/YafQ-DinJ toxin-antitoxin module
MAQSAKYVNVKTDKESRRRAKIIKTKLGLTWSEFLNRAADELDPDEQTND